MNLGLDENAIPVCEPFLSIDDVLIWSPPEFCCNGAKFYAEWKKLEFENKPEGKVGRPQFLICHDMSGGYLDDRFTQGSNNSEAYRFYNWNVIDTFVYFSHSFITTPPFGWVCAAHRHGVNILGTIITEWEAGENICKKLLQSKEYIDAFISKLVEIMLFYGFDGWLINIENAIKGTDICLLQYFAHQLTVRCHFHLSYAKVIWYDSVISSGDLLWQNELNDKNEMFFEVSDGIFLNYALTEETLERSVTKAKKASRQFDVYAGVDVFGRQTPGGGGFNCKQIIERILHHGLSCALFAQGWVYETGGVEDFDYNEQKFWHLLEEYLPLKSVSLPINTSFCQGFGKKYYLEGQVISELKWHNLSLQQLQPSYPWEYEHKDAFIGGGCLKLTLPKKDSMVEVISKRLFRVLLAKKEQLHLSTIWKVHGLKSNQSYDVGFVLRNECMDSPTSLFLIDGHSVDEESIVSSVNTGIFRKKPIQLGKSVFLFTENGLKNKNYDWKESIFSFDTNHLMENGKETVTVSVEMAIILIPNQSLKSDLLPSSVSISIGHIRLYEQGASEGLVPVHLVKDSCLLVEKSSRICHQDMKAIVTHPCFHMQWEEPCPEHLKTKTQATQNSSVAHNELECLNLSEGKVGIVMASHQTSFFCLHWRLSQSKFVNFYLIFYRDSSDVEHFVGSTVSNCYAFIHNQGDAIPVRFIIQPVFRDARLFGDKFVIDLKQ